MEISGENSPDIYRKLSDFYAGRGDKEKQAYYAKKAGDKETVRKIYSEMSVAYQKKKDWLQAAVWASRAGNPVRATKMSIEWTKSVMRDMASSISGNGQMAERAIDDLARVILPDKTKSAFREKLEEIAVRYATLRAINEHPRSDAAINRAVELAKEYGRIGLVFKNLEIEGRYKLARDVAKAEGLTELVEIYDRIIGR
jgi:hypothetical protein